MADVYPKEFYIAFYCVERNAIRKIRINVIVENYSELEDLKNGLEINANAIVETGYTNTCLRLTVKENDVIEKRQFVLSNIISFDTNVLFSDEIIKVNNNYDEY